MLHVVSELYYPEDAATAHYMTGVAEHLARCWPVRVVCAKPKYNTQLRHLPKRERHNGVEIHRCWCTTFDKNHLLGRAINVVTASLSMLLALLVSLRRGDRALVVTNPPVLPFVVLLACRARGASCCLRIDDVYPEAMVHGGLIRPGATAAQLLNWMNRQLYRRMNQVVVLGRDMRRLVEQKLGGPSGNLVVIPNWADLDIVAPAGRRGNKLLREYGLEDKFVVGYAGNIGRVQAVEVIVGAARQLKQARDIHFLFVGAGQKLPWLRRAIEQGGLENVTLAGQRARAEQDEFLNACEVGVVSLALGMSGAGVPSRLYNLMAAGRPVIAVMDDDCEAAMVVRENQIGWVVPPDDPQKIADAIVEARSDRQRLRELGARSRRAAEENYSRERVLAMYGALFQGVDAERGAAGSAGQATVEGQPREQPLPSELT
jgi:glycosyltransferase involved in cell wall biosynthesis